MLVTTGQRGGTSEHQASVQNVFVVLTRRGVAFDLAQKRLEGDLGQFRLRHLNRSKRRCCKFGQSNVVEANYRKIIRYSDVLLISFPHESYRCHVVGT